MRRYLFVYVERKRNINNIRTSIKNIPTRLGFFFRITEITVSQSVYFHLFWVNNNLLLNRTILYYRIILRCGASAYQVRTCNAFATHYLL